MADKIVQIDGVGNVAFPDTMSDSDISGVIQKQYHPKAPAAAAPAQQPGLVDRAWNSVKSAFAGVSPMDALLGGGNGAAGVMNDQARQDQAQMLSEQAQQKGPAGDLARQTQDLQKIQQTSVIPQKIRTRAQKATDSALQNYPRIHGLANAAGTLASTLTTPDNAATLSALAIPGVGEAAAFPFMADAVKGAITEGRQGLNATDPGESWEHMANAGVQGLMGMLPMLHAGEAPTPEAPAPVAEAPKAPFYSEPVPMQGHLFDTRNEPTAPTDTTPAAPVPTRAGRPTPEGQLDMNFGHPAQRDLFADHGENYNPPAVTPTPRTNPVQQALPGIQGNLFSNPETAQTAAPATADAQTNQFGFAPMQGRLFTNEGQPTPEDFSRTPDTRSPVDDSIAAARKQQDDLQAEHEKLKAENAALKQADAAQQAAAQQPKRPTGEASKATVATAIKWSAPETKPVEAPKAEEPKAEEKALPEPQTPLTNDAKQGPQLPTEVKEALAETPSGAKPRGDLGSGVADSARNGIGKILNLSRLIKGHQVHETLDRAITETQSMMNPRASSVGAGLNKEDQALLSHLMGEKVGSVLTPEQFQKAYQLKGKVGGSEPAIQYRPDATKKNIMESRALMARDLELTTDPARKAALQEALEPKEDGKVKPILYKPLREDIPNGVHEGDHPEAPFKTVRWGAAAPKITLKNLKAALPEENVRGLGLGIADEDLRAQRKVAAPQATDSGTADYLANADSFQNNENKMNRKGITGDARQDRAEVLTNALHVKINQLANGLRDDLASFKQKAGGDPLVDQINKLAPEALGALPKEVQDLVKPAESETPKAMATTPDEPRVEATTTTSEAAPAKAAATRPVENKVAKAPKELKTTFSDVKEAAQYVANISKFIAEKYPTKKRVVSGIFDAAVEHFGNDTEGATKALASAMNIYKREMLKGNEWAAREAVKDIRRRTPDEDLKGQSEPTSTSIGTGKLTGRDGLDNDENISETTWDKRRNGLPVTDTELTFNSGLNPEHGIKLAKDIVKGAQKLNRSVRPKLTSSDLLTTAHDAAENRLSRYEKMDPTNRSAYANQIWSAENDKLMEDADPDEKNGFADRLAELRKTVPQNAKLDVNALFTKFFTQHPDAAEAARTIRATNGKRARADSIVEHSLNKVAREMDQWSDYDSRDFINKMERGLDQGDESKNQLASLLRSALDNARDGIKAVNGDFQHYLEDYFPHIWANVGRGMELSKKLGGMSGDQSFLKTRELDTFNEGIAMGLQPVTQNPAKLALMRIHQMNRYAMREAIKQEMLKSGSAQYYESGKPVPAGLVPLNDSAFEKGGGLAGRYYANPEVAKVFNNFTSKGLSSSSIGPAYDMLRKTTNFMNMAQLSLSGLHGTFSAVNSVISGAGRGLATIVNERSAEGLTKGVGQIGKSLNVYGTWKMGNNLLQHVKDPNAFQELSALGNAWERAGNRVGEDPYSGTQMKTAMDAAWKRAMDDSLTGLQRGQAGVSAILHTAGRAIEKSNGVIMNHLVPQFKAASFAKMANDILADDSLSPKEVDMKLQQVSNDMDDRFGQMVYDNMFMNRAMKDVLHVTMRSPGWNIGTLRAGAGGMTDLVKSFHGMTKGEKFQVTDRTAYLAALTATTMIINAALTKFNTGQNPDGWADYFFARTGGTDSNGEPNRIMPKLYTYDYINMVNHPVTTLLHKSAPWISTMSDLYANKTFYGREIYDRGSTPGAKIADVIRYMAGNTVTPFSVSNLSESRARGGSVGGSVLGSLTGVLPAPKWAGRTAAENLANEYFSGEQAAAGEAGDNFDKKQSTAALASQYRNGQITWDDVWKKVQSGEVPAKFLDHLQDAGSNPPLERWTKGIKSNQHAMNVFKRGTPEERERLAPNMYSRLDRITDPDEMQTFYDQIQQGLGSHPDTHVFSPGQYQKNNPGADVHEAVREARKQGYAIHAH